MKTTITLIMCFAWHGLAYSGNPTNEPGTLNLSKKSHSNGNQMLPLLPENPITPLSLEAIDESPLGASSIGDILQPSGFGVGNGGDFVRSAFIKKGREIYNYLLNDPIGQNFTKTHELNPQSFGAILNTRVILPVFEKPIDNQGQPVDAIWEAGNIFLYVPTWESFLTSDSDVYMMVLHEILRSTGHDDDNFKVSSLFGFKGGSEVEPAELVSCTCSNTVNRFLGTQSQYRLNCIDMAAGANLVSDYFVGSLQRCYGEKKRVLNFYGVDYEIPENSHPETAVLVNVRKGAYFLRGHVLEFEIEGQEDAGMFSLKCPNSGSRRYKTGLIERPNELPFLNVKSGTCKLLDSRIRRLLTKRSRETLEIQYQNGYVIRFKFDGVWYH